MFVQGIQIVLGMFVGFLIIIAIIFMIFLLISLIEKALNSFF
jgi:uncharacterized membrane protein